MKFSVKPYKRARFQTLLNGVLDAMRGKFLNAILHSAPGNEHHFLLYEAWRDHQDVLDTQLHWPYRAQ